MYFLNQSDMEMSIDDTIPCLACRYIQRVFGKLEKNYPVPGFQTIEIIQYQFLTIFFYLVFVFKILVHGTIFTLSTLFLFCYSVMRFCMPKGL